MYNIPRKHCIVHTRKLNTVLWYIATTLATSYTNYISKYELMVYMQYVLERFFIYFLTYISGFVYSVLVCIPDIHLTNICFRIIGWKLNCVVDIPYKYEWKVLKK
jgi:hypothetical protein